MPDLTDDPLAVSAYQLGIGPVEIEACASHDELRDLVLEALAERGRRAQLAAHKERLRQRQAMAE